MTLSKMNKIFIVAVVCIGMLFASGQKESEANSGSAQSEKKAAFRA